MEVVAQFLCINLYLNSNGIADLSNLTGDLTTYDVDCIVKSASNLPIGDVVSSDPYLVVKLSAYKSV